MCNGSFAILTKLGSSHCKSIPFDDNAVGAIKVFKDDLSSAALGVIDEKLSFVLETDASENAIFATLNQQDRPVAFFFRMLNTNERQHVSVEQEAWAIVEAFKKWQWRAEVC